MKTKEIEVFITEEDFKNLQLDNDKDFYAAVNRVRDTGDLKAKLIIEIPEKKIEITESQFDLAARIGLGAALKYDDVIKVIKKELFGEES